MTESNHGLPDVFMVLLFVSYLVAAWYLFLPALVVDRPAGCDDDGEAELRAKLRRVWDWAANSA